MHFTLNQKINHKKFGEGVIIGFEVRETEHSNIPNSQVIRVQFNKPVRDESKPYYFGTTLNYKGETIINSIPANVAFFTEFTLTQNIL